MTAENCKNKVNFTEGIVPPNQLETLKEKNQDIGFLISHFKEVKPSRYPVLVAQIIEAENNKLETVFHFEKLKNVLNRAGSRPIICVACLGRYQSGKSSTLAGLTGNWAHKSGDGVVEETEGVYVDGPYELDDLYQRFGIKPSDDLFFVNNEDLTPVIFFFDIEGYGGKIHGVISDANNEAYVKLCTPFLCICSAFYLMSVPAPDIDEVKKMVNVMQISNLTIKSQVKGNGEIKIIIGITNYSSMIKYKEDINKKTVLKAIEKAKAKLEKFWYGIDQFREYGVVSDFVPMVSISAYETFLYTFEYFAQNIIRSIENASQGNYMRSVDENMALFQYVVDHYLDPGFKNEIKIKITEVHDNTMRAIAYRTMNECVSKYNKEFDDLIHTFEEDYHINHDLSPILEEFKKNTKEMMINKVNVISESSREVGIYMNQAVELVSKHIREKFDIYQKEKNKFLIIEEMKAVEHAKQLENMKKCVQKFIDLELIKMLYKSKKPIIKRLRSDLLIKRYYLENYEKTDVFVTKIFDQFKQNIKQNDVIEKCKQKLQSNENVDHELFNETLDHYKDENNFKSIVDQVIANKSTEIENSINTEFDEARLSLSDSFDEFKKEKVRVLLFLTIVNTYKRTKTIFPDGSYHVTDYVFIKSKKSFLTYDES